MTHFYKGAPRNTRRKGISTVLFVLSMPVMLGVTGLVIDLTNLYTRRAIAQRAADAAALAGAMVSKWDPVERKLNTEDIRKEAINYAVKNGYSSEQTSVNPDADGSKSRVSVTVGRDERVYFTPVLELLLGSNPIYSRRVSSSATAEKITSAHIPMGGNYGTTTGVSNPAVFGPYAKHSYGDPYSVKYHDDGTLNDLANRSKNKGIGWDDTSVYQEGGYTYTMKLSKEYVQQYKDVKVQLYDPDGYDSKDGKSLDEIHNDYAGPNKPAQSEATTEYTVYQVRKDGSLREIAKSVYGNDKATDAGVLAQSGRTDLWITPDGFKFNTADFGEGEYKIRVKSIDGSSENGYNLRAGPDYTGELSEADWNTQFGDKGGTDPGNVKIPISADDHMQMNFTQTSRDVSVILGDLPKEAAGKKITVTKFDTDVGSNSIKYYYKDSSGQRVYAQGANFLDNRNDFWSQNEVQVPADFPGGTWYAEYDAGQNDTSSWSVKYPGPGDGSVKLVK
jgi:Flp pilus assembly protein TadG